MRPEILFGLFSPLTTLPHVGPKTAKLLEKLCGPRVLNLCWHLPVQLEHRHDYPTLQSAQDKTLGTFVVTVGGHAPRPSRRQPNRVHCYDETGEMDLIFFHANGDYLAQALPAGKTRLISGLVERKFGRLQMIHPHHIGTPEDKAQWVGTQPLYPMTASLHKKTLAKALSAALGMLPQLPEWISKDILHNHQWTSWKESLLTLHQPKTQEDLEPSNPALQRLAFDEMLAHQLMLKLLKEDQGNLKGKSLKGSGTLEKKLIQRLPFSLTEGQKSVLHEIKQDLASPEKMVRLLQGDVGSGKTLVAFLSILTAIESGMQAAFLAPTEILAQQHYATMKNWCDDLNISIGLFTGSLTAKEKRENLEKLKQGEYAIAVGTHALLEADIHFQNLALAVIDEQHRFGVDQRSKLIEKGPECNVLAMTATPIPRTLALTLYGDIDISSLKEKPAYRQPIDTRVMALNKTDDIYQGLQRVLQKGDQIYWICPLVEESEALNLGHVEERFQSLNRVFKDKVGFLHGRLKAQDKEDIMARFKSGEIQILVSTTVVEVGVDVPNATVIVIEHAERFGLFQLHQLRGRVGRGSKPSSCLLLYDTPLSTTARQRLQTLRDTNDGFKIAEADLKLRGSGDLLGTRQSGLPSFRFFHFAEHAHLLNDINQYSQAIVREKLYLKEGLNKALKCLLYLFNHERALHYLKSG